MNGILKDFIAATNVKKTDSQTLEKHEREEEKLFNNCLVIPVLGSVVLSFPEDRSEDSKTA